MVLNSLPTKLGTNAESHQKAAASSDMHEANVTQCSSGTSIALKDLSTLSVRASAFSGLVVPLSTFALVLINSSRV